MINYFSYFFYNLSNLLFIILIPENFSKFFFINYSIASGIFTFIIFYHFSKKEILTEKKIFIILLILLAIFEILNSKSLIIWYFTFLIIYFDYFFSQKNNYLINFIFKFFLLLSSFLLYNNFIQPMIVLKIKIITVLIALLYYFFFSKKGLSKPLRVNSPIIYNFFTCLIYFLSLFLITILVPNSFVKLIYITFQILIGFQLKIFDLKIRDIYINSFNLDILFNIFSFTCIIFVSFLSELYYLIVFHLFVFFSLALVKKKYISQK